MKYSTSKYCAVTVLLLTACFSTASLDAQTVLSVPAVYPKIQAAIDAASSSTSTIINVAPGTYREHNIVMRGKKIVLQSTGGAANTIIDGESKYTIFEVHDNETLSTQIIGFTIQNGNGVNNVPDPWTNSRGQSAGGIAIYGTATSLTVKNCIFKNNRTVLIESRPGELAPPLRPLASRVAGYSGGAIRITSGGTLSVSGCTFSNNNSSAHGGAISVSNSSALISTSTFTGNRSAFGGGAIKATPPFDGRLEITSNTFTGNIARGLSNPTNDGSGGAIRISYGGDDTDGVDFYTLIDGNLFTGNIARFAGGALSIFGANAKITNNTFDANNPDYPNNPDLWYDPADQPNNRTGVYGGAIHLETQGAGNGGNRKFEITSNTITGNKVRHQGGGIMAYFENSTSTLLVSNNQIIGNIAEYPNLTYTSTSVPNPYGGQKMGQGGGFLISAPVKKDGKPTGPNGSVSTFTSNLIQSNSSQEFGGGFFSGGKIVMQKTTMDSNLGIFRHGGLVCKMNADFNISGNAFRRNKVADQWQSSSGDRAGAIFFTDVRDSNGILDKNEFSYNRGRLGGAVFLNSSTGKLKVTNNTFKSNITTSYDSNAQRLNGGTVSADGGGVVPTGMAVEAFTNKFIGDAYYITLYNYASSKISILNNAFSGATVGVARAKLDNASTVPYMTVSSLNATSFADGNTGTP